MRIKVINPNTTAGMTAKIGEAARAIAAPGTEILAVNPAFGPVSIEAFIAVFVILDPDTVESYPGSTTLPRRRSYAQSHARLTLQLAYSCSILPCIGPLHTEPEIGIIRHTLHPS